MFKFLDAANIRPPPVVPKVMSVSSSASSAESYGSEPPASLVAKLVVGRWLLLVPTSLAGEVPSVVGVGANCSGFNGSV